MASKRKIITIRVSYQMFKNKFLNQFRDGDTVYLSVHYDNLKKNISQSKASKVYNTAKDLGIAKKDSNRIVLTEAGLELVKKAKPDKITMQEQTILNGILRKNKDFVQLWYRVVKDRKVVSTPDCTEIFEHLYPNISQQAARRTCEQTLNWARVARLAKDAPNGYYPIIWPENTTKVEIIQNYFGKESIEDFFKHQSVPVPVQEKSINKNKRKKERVKDYILDLLGQTYLLSQDPNPENLKELIDLIRIIEAEKIFPELEKNILVNYISLFESHPNNISTVSQTLLKHLEAFWKLNRRK